MLFRVLDRPLDDYAEVAGRIEGLDGVRYALPLVEGFAAFWRGDYEIAADRLHGARFIANSFGGSHAQRDILRHYLSAEEAGGSIDVTMSAEIQTLVSRDKPVTVLPDLPPLHGGIVGFLGYDVVREVERLPSPPPDDLGLPDAVLSVIGHLAAFDHWRQRVCLIENVLVGALGRVCGPRYGVVTWSPRLRREALDHLDRVGLGDQAFQRADTLSGGQQQRVALARTLMQGPSLVLADEPVASLDPENAASVMDLLFRVCREDRLTVLCTLHQVDLALEWADRLIGLRDGRKVLDQRADGTSRAEAMEVYRRIAAPATDADTRAEAVLAS